MQIEKGIPLPPEPPSLTKILKAMEVGDSVLSPATPESTRSTCNALGKKLGWKFARRKIARDGLRIWRVA